MRSRTFPAIVALLLTAPLSAQITIDPFSPTAWCAGNSVVLPFTAVGVFNPGNIFTAELSDASGSFAAPVVIGSVAGTASGSVTCDLPNGIAGAAFRLRVSSDSPVMTGAPNNTDITIEAPNAGVNSSATICGNFISAMAFLGGTPDPGGIWSFSSGTGVWMSGDQFSADNGDVLQYTVVSPGGCSDVALVVVSVVQPANAGNNATITVCSSDAPVGLFSLLGGAAQSGGAWTNPGGAPVSGLFDPAVDPAGCYTYVVAGDPPCANDVATVCVSVNQQVDLGMDAAISLCGGGPMVNLGNGLPIGGTCTYLGAPHPGTFVPGVDWNGPYVYTVTGVAPCLAESVTFNVSVVSPRKAGAAGTVAWCQRFGNIDLFAQLGGTPDAGGFWTDDNATGALTGATFAAGNVPPGTYAFTYSAGTAPCTPVSATVTVNVGPCLLPPDTGLPVE